VLRQRAAVERDQDPRDAKRLFGQVVALEREDVLPGEEAAQVLVLTAQGPNSSSVNPLPPLPSTTQRMTRRYMAETMTTVKTTIQMLAPSVTWATPATTISLRNGPKTYSGDVAGSPPPANAPWKALASLCDTCAMRDLVRRRRSAAAGQMEREAWRVLRAGRR